MIFSNRCLLKTRDCVELIDYPTTKALFFLAEVMFVCHPEELGAEIFCNEESSLITLSQ